MAEEFTKICVDALIRYLKDELPQVPHISSEWPTANIPLKYPSITVMTASPDFRASAPRLHASGIVDTDPTSPSYNQAVNAYVVGQYDVLLNVHIWGRNKPERASAYDAFFKALNKQINPMGLRLQLPDYFDEWVNYTQLSYRYVDDETASQTQTWRAIVDVVLTCNAILTKTDYIITQPIEFVPSQIISDEPIID